MPSTLAHMGLQGLLTRGLSRNVDLKWVYVGCVIPDLPWILQRAVRAMVPSSDPIALRTYFTVQTSLAFCVVLAAAMAALSSRAGRTFLILAGSALVHLLLDAAQEKWSNGVLLAAPFSWRATSLGLFRSEGLTDYVITGVGLVFVLYSWKTSVSTPTGLMLHPCVPRRLSAGLLLAVYLLLPVPLMTEVSMADVFCTGTLSRTRDRAGRPVAFDRAEYAHSPSGGVLRAWVNEDFEVEGLDLGRSARVSLRGTFVSRSRIRVDEYHAHAVVVRDAASCVGLALLGLLWIQALRREVAGGRAAKGRGNSDSEGRRRGVCRSPET